MKERISKRIKDEFFYCYIWYLSEDKSCKLFRQLISVIEYLNELGISHRDIKPENILLDDEQENLKLLFYLLIYPYPFILSTRKR